MPPKTHKVRSINNVKHDGQWHLPDTKWDCPVKDCKALIESGSIEYYNEPPVQDEKPIELPAIDTMKKKELVAELTQRNVPFNESETVDDLREVLAMAREAHAK